MKRTKECLAIVAAILLLASCSSIRPQSPLARLAPPSEGEAKLIAIEMPEYVHEDLPYDVLLTIRSRGTLQIRRVCFDWLGGRIPSISPSNNCYTANGELSSGTGNPCYSRTGSLTPGSARFCVEASQIRMEMPGKLVVRIRPAGLKTSYNRLEAQVEYVYKGQLKVTNVVETPITVDR